MLLGPACLDILLAPFRRRPVGRHGLRGDEVFFLFLDRLLRRLQDARIDHLATPRHVAMPGQLAVDRVKHGLAGAGLDQAFLEVPDRGTVRNLAAVAQTDKTLEAQAVSSWNSIYSSLRLNSCWISSTRTISSVGNGGRPPRSRLGRGAA